MRTKTSQPLTLPNRTAIVFFPHELQHPCRCGMRSRLETCPLCRDGVCQDCAVFVDPETRHPARPSHLIAQGVRTDFLAHRSCLSAKDMRLASCVYASDVPLMVQILKGGKPMGRALDCIV
ncbi:hypothetical protein J7643_15485 [bacterium]|nr:hypothetical protein [bacterium]